MLPWLAATEADLIARLRGSRMPHALLFTGPAGIGKRQLADALARAALCESPAENGGACGACKGCLLVQAGTHPDRLVIEPEEDSTQIKVDQVRALIEYMTLSHTRAPFKVALVDPAEAMNANAANSLLKTLEEPPANALILLVSARPGRLLATVRSRCQRIAVAGPEPAQALAWVKQTCPQAEAESLLALANGAPLAAARLAESGLTDRRRDLLDALAGLVGAKGRGVIDLAGSFKDLPAGTLVAWLLALVEDSLRTAAADATPRLAMPGDLRRALERLDSRTRFDLLDRLREFARLAEAPLNRELFVEHVLVTWVELTS